MKLREDQITSKERVFVEHFARTDDATYAAIRAGYGNVGNAASLLPTRPRLAGPLAEARELLQTKGAMRGVKTLLRLAKDDVKNPPGVQRAAASDLLKHSGVSAAEEAMRKEIHEMTLDEMDKRRQELMSQAADRAKTIEHVAQPAPNSTPDADVFG